MFTHLSHKLWVIILTKKSNTAIHIEFKKKEEDNVQSKIKERNF